LICCLAFSASVHGSVVSHLAPPRGRLGDGECDTVLLSQIFGAVSELVETITRCSASTNRAALVQAARQFADDLSSEQRKPILIVIPETARPVQVGGEVEMRFAHLKTHHGFEPTRASPSLMLLPTWRSKGRPLTLRWPSAASSAAILRRLRRSSVLGLAPKQPLGLCHDCRPRLGVRFPAFDLRSHSHPCFATRFGGGSDGGYTQG
jgi:hypothetical protein